MILQQPLEIISVVRKMRGRSEAFLVQASDGTHYVAKFTGNPEGNRSLINECIASHLLMALGVPTPTVAILRLGDSCQGREKLYFSNQELPIAPGLHFGSKCPVEPHQVAIFDFLPRDLFSQVANLGDFGVVFAFDQWVANMEARQFIFARQPNPTPDVEAKQQRGPLIMWAIDNGMCFGADWTFTGKSRCSASAYHPFWGFHSASDLQQAANMGVELIQCLPDSVFQAIHRTIYRQIAESWRSPGDDAALEEMLDQLRQRQQTLVPALDAALVRV